MNLSTEVDKLMQELKQAEREVKAERKAKLARFTERRRSSEHMRDVKAENEQLKELEL